MPADALRPRSTSEILDDSIQLLRSRYGALLILSIVALFPRLIYSVYSGSFLLPVLQGGPARQAQSAVMLLWSFPLGVLVLAWVLVVDAAIIVVAAAAFRGETVSPGAALQAALARAGTIVMSGFVKYLMIALGFVIPGIVVSIALPLVLVSSQVSRGALPFALVAIVCVIGFALWWGFKMFARYFAIPAVVVLEGLPWRAALRRSRALARGETRKILLTLALLFLVYNLVAVSASLFLAHLLPTQTLGQVVAQILVMFAYPILEVATVGLYYDVRVRKEALDIELMTRGLAATPVQHPAL